MWVAAMFVGVLAGLTGFVVALLSGFGLLIALGCYAGAGSLVTVITLAALVFAPSDMSTAQPA